MWPRTSRGARSASAAGCSPGGTQDQGKRPDRSPAPRDTARPCHASLPVQLKQEQDAFRPGDGAPARPPTRSPSRRRSLERGYRGRKRTPQTATQEPSRRANSSPACKPLSLPAPKSHIWMGAGRCWSTRTNSHTNAPVAAPGRFPKHCRSNLQQEQACPGLSGTGDISASAAGLWSSLPRLQAESQPL